MPEAVIDVVTRDEVLGRCVCLLLENEGYNCRVMSPSGYKCKDCDLVVLDVDDRAAKHIVNSGNAKILTVSYAPGADMLRPFDLRRFCAEVARALGTTHTTERTGNGAVTASICGRTLMADGRAFAVSRKEAALLLLLLERRGRIVTFDEAAEAIGGDVGSLRVHILLLRKKLSARSVGITVKSVRGKGYTIE